MKIEFVGGAGTVTGSSYIVKDDDFTIMVDCGMFQGKRELRERNSLSLIYDPPKIDTVLLTHAHIDHSGLVPKLIKDGFYGNIYTTKATADLCSVMFPDSAHIQEMDVKWINKKNKKLGRELEEPLYGSEDAAKALKHLVSLNYGEIVQIHPRVEVRFRDAGHILGSAIIEMWVEEKGKKTKIVFSGDLGPKGQAIIRDPEVISEADILFIESTYGDRLHKNKEDTYQEFKEIIVESLNGSGNIVIPSFAIERTQELIYTLSNLIKDGEIPGLPVYIDSPLAISATEIFRENPQCFDKETRDILLSGESPLDFNSLTFTRKTEESKRLNEVTGSVIISASGMCTAGRIKHHLKNNIYKTDASVVFVGYQAEGTLGRRIIEGAKQVKLYGEDVAVKAKIHTLGGFSAHADRNGLLEWMGNIDNKNLKVFVVHGEEKASKSLADAINDKYGYTAYVPSWGEIVDVDTMESSGRAHYGTGESGEVRKAHDPVDQEINSLSRSFEQLISQYKQAKDENRLGDLNRLKEDINDVKEMVAVLVDEL
ncbi:MAG: MBL fold metallo-hydrolase [bacterium]|nr:MBL fold metallo-hydrolase [bacterium]